SMIVAQLIVEASQQTSNGLVVAVGPVTVPKCNGANDFTVTLASGRGVYEAGSARVVAAAIACDSQPRNATVSCSAATVTQTANRGRRNRDLAKGNKLQRPRSHAAAGIAFIACAPLSRYSPRCCGKPAIYHHLQSALAHTSQM